MQELGGGARTIYLLIIKFGVTITKNALQTIAAAVIGGVLFYYLSLPLPWMLGSLTGVLIFKACGREPNLPMPIRNCGVIVLGAMMGAWFTPDTLRQIVAQLPGMILVTGASLLFGFGAAVLTSHQTGVSLTSSLLGSTPGGLSQMIILCDEFEDADLSAVSVLQTVRLLSVIFIVPFLAIHAVSAGDMVAVSGGAAGTAVEMGLNEITVLYTVCAIAGTFAANRLSFPTPYMLGPLLGVAVLGVAGFSLPRTPLFISAPAQICMGAYMGVGIDVNSLRQRKRLLVYAVLGGLTVVASSLVSAWLLTWFYQVELKTAFLSAAPGGIAEMGITAAMINADVSIVTAYQIFRMLFINVAVPFFFKWWLRKPAAT